MTVYVFIVYASSSFQYELLLSRVDGNPEIDTGVAFHCAYKVTFDALVTLVIRKKRPHYDNEASYDYSNEREFRVIKLSVEP